MGINLAGDSETINHVINNNIINSNNNINSNNKIENSNDILNVIGRVAIVAFCVFSVYNIHKKLNNVSYFNLINKTGINFN